MGLRDVESVKQRETTNHVCLQTVVLTNLKPSQNQVTLLNPVSKLGTKSDDRIHKMRFPNVVHNQVLNSDSYKISVKNSTNERVQSIHKLNVKLWRYM